MNKFKVLIQKLNTVFVIYLDVSCNIIRQISDSRMHKFDKLLIWYVKIRYSIKFEICKYFLLASAKSIWPVVTEAYWPKWLAEQNPYLTH